MIDADYNRIMEFLDTINRLTRSADRIKKIQEKTNKNEARAELFLHINGQTEAITLSEKTTELTLSESIRSCNDSVKELKEGIDKILDNYLFRE